MAKPVRKQSNVRFVGALVVIAIVGVGILGYSLSRPRAGIKPVDPNLAAGTAEGYLVTVPGTMPASDSLPVVQVIEFGDFECPVCAQWAQVTEPDVKERLIKSGRIEFRYYDFPLDMHPHAWPASNAAACAAEQGKFSEMHDQIFALQDQWSGATGHANPKPAFETAAKASGVDVAAWEACFDSQKHYPRIKANLELGLKYGVGSTPSFVIGTKLYPGRLPFDEFKRYVDEAAAELAAASKAGKGAKAPPTKSGN